MKTSLLHMLVLFLSGGICAELAKVAGLPMPFMLGGIVGAASAVLLIEQRRGPSNLHLPQKVRAPFVALIGTMIGVSFTPALLEVLPQFWISGLAVLPFILLAHAGGYSVMRYLGGYRPVDALFAAMPGGFVESVIMGEKAGADVQVLAVQQFIRIILVVSVVPLLFWLITGQVVGSAAGQTLAQGAWSIVDLGLIALISGIGMVLGRFARVPAPQFMGPLFLCAALQVAGVVSLHAPSWLLSLAQMVIGVSLGGQFSGIRRATLLRGLGIGIIAVAVMLGLSFGFAFGLGHLVPAQTAALFLAFAPGGVTEMSLIALSLHLSPVIVAVHHLIRIVLTVVLTGIVFKRVGP